LPPARRSSPLSSLHLFGTGRQADLDPQLKSEYEYEQRKELWNAIAKHRARLVEAAESYHHRMLNIYENAEREWFDVRGDYGTLHYYFHSSVLRFVTLLAHVHHFERSSLVLDRSVAKEDEFAFLAYIKAMRWAATDVSLFNGLEYDRSSATDHFFADRLREICFAVYERPDDEVGLAKIVDLAQGPKLNAVFEFFDGLKRAEYRLRWDRLAVLHLIVMAFLNRFGYPMQESSDERL
jgi:hypothetical protein